MKWQAKSLVFGVAASALLLLLGFIVFTASATRRVAAFPAGADAIVVLTGANQRIEAGLLLLRAGLGRRLLISGVNRRTTPEDVMRVVGTDFGSSSCCIDFGYAAHDTVGNASETKAWVDRHHFTRIIVVTSSYHMPRSLNELTLALPDVELIAYPVLPRMLSEGVWWLRPSAARVLVSEYLKLLPSYARVVASRLLKPLDTATLPGSGREQARAGIE